MGFSLEPFETRISPSAVIHPSATIASNSVRIGRNVKIDKNVIIHEQTIIDDGVTIRSGSILGNTCNLTGNSHYSEMNPSGGVHIQRDADIHANTIIDRALLKGYTDIGQQTKIDNLVHIGRGRPSGNDVLWLPARTSGISLLSETIRGRPGSTLVKRILIGDNVYITLGFEECPAMLGIRC